MTDADAQALAELVAQVVMLLDSQQRHLLTIEAYLAEQRGYDAARFGVLFAEFGADPAERLERMQRQLEAARSALSAWLRDYQAPPH